MEKLSKKQVEQITKKLKPFWKKHRKLQSDFWEKERELEKEMNNKLKTKAKLSFFYVDGECVGIGADNYSDRENFPLIHDTELD